MAKNHKTKRYCSAPTFLCHWVCAAYTVLMANAAKAVAAAKAESFLTIIVFIKPDVCWSIKYEKNQIFTRKKSKHRATCCSPGNNRASCCSSNNTSYFKPALFPMFQRSCCIYTCICGMFFCIFSVKFLKKALIRTMFVASKFVNISKMFFYFFFRCNVFFLLLY